MPTGMTAAPIEHPPEAPRRPRPPSRHVEGDGGQRPAFHAGSSMPALRRVGTPRMARRFGVLLMSAFVVTPMVLGFVPWRQAVHGDGSIIGYHPLDREFKVASPIYGRVMEYYVGEGDAVAPGDLIARVENIDTQYVETLEAQLELAEQQFEFAEQQVEAYRDVAKQAEAARGELVAAAEADVAGAEQKLQEALGKRLEAGFDLDGYRWKYEQAEKLVSGGLDSGQSLIAAEQVFRTAEQKAEQAGAAIEAARASKRAYEAKVRSTEAKALADIQKAMTEVQNAQVKVREYGNKLQELGVKIRQQEQGSTIRAPRAGRVLRLLTNVGPGAQVKDGDPLAILIPETQRLAAEVYLPGRDIPLVHPGAPVRLQFEGWPAVQFVGWPSVAVGTFPGKVALVDASDTKPGKFRILVVPDLDGPEIEYRGARSPFAEGAAIRGAESGAKARVREVRPGDDQSGTLVIEMIAGEFLPDEPIRGESGGLARVRNPWPSQRFLRQGARANGWVLLRKVPLGFEIWRRINGFPPVLDEQGPDGESGYASAGDEKQEKPPKLKRPK